MLPCPNSTWAAREVQNSGEWSPTNPSADQNWPYCEGEDILEASSSFSPRAVEQSGDSLFAAEFSYSTATNTIQQLSSEIQTLHIKNKLLFFLSWPKKLCSLCKNTTWRGHLTDMHYVLILK